MESVIAILQVVVANLPGAITTAEQLYDLGTKLYATTQGTEPSEADKALLQASIDADLLEALTPLPPAQAGDPDYQG